jgi:hypothetical protein
MDHQFENHPAISAEYVNFLATNLGYDKAEKLEKAVTIMQANVAKAVEIADKGLAKATLLIDKFSAVDKEMEALKKRVQVLESNNK